jgi:hypothetical protein
MSGGDVHAATAGVTLTILERSATTPSAHAP